MELSSDPQISKCPEPILSGPRKPFPHCYHGHQFRAAGSGKVHYHYLVVTLVLVSAIIAPVLVSAVIAPPLKTAWRTVLIRVVLIRAVVVNIVLVVHIARCLLGLMMSALAVIGIHAWDLYERLFNKYNLGVVPLVSASLSTSPPTNL